MASFEGSHAPRQAVASPLAPAPWTKLRVSDPNDPLQREADHVAEAVQRAPAGHAIAAAAAIGLAGGAARPVRRSCDECSEAHVGTLRSSRSSVVTTRMSPDDVTGPPSLHGRGRPLSPPVRTFFETRLGRDLGRVRVHTDNAAARSARQINARAYTVGRDIAFAAGEYTPETASGRRLLAHELTHTLQQRPRRLVQRQPAQGPPATAAELYETYRDDLPALGKELYRLVSESVDNIDLVLGVLDETPWIWRDDVAYYVVQPVPEETLREFAVDARVRDLLGRLRTELAGGAPFPSEKAEVAKIDRALTAAAPEPTTFILPSLDEGVPAFPVDVDPFTDLEGDVARHLYADLEVAWSWLTAEPATAVQLLDAMQHTAETMQPLIECVTTRSDSVGADALERLIDELGYAIERLSEPPAADFDDLRDQVAVIANSILELDPTLASLEESGSVGSCVSVVLLPLARGLGEAVSALEPEQARKFAANITDNPFFGPGFTLGAQVGIVLDAKDFIFDVLAAVMDPAAAATALRESIEQFAALIDELSGPTGADVAEEIGRAIGQRFIDKIAVLNRANGQFMFAFELGKVVGPSIIYTILSLLGFEAVVAGRLLHLAEGALTRLKGFATLARSLRRSPDVDLPSAERGLPEGSRPKGRAPEIEPDADERALLERTGRVTGDLNDDDAVAELAIALSREKVPFSDPEYPNYISEVDLGNGHRWRESRLGMWCRFSEKPTNCMPTLVAQGRAALEQHLAKVVQTRLQKLRQGAREEFPGELATLENAVARGSLGETPLVVGQCGKACELMIGSPIGKSLAATGIREVALPGHSFVVARRSDGMDFLVDITVRQFINEDSPWEQGAGLIGTMMRGDPDLPANLPIELKWTPVDDEINDLAQRLTYRDTLLNDGYVPLTPDVARVHAWAITEGLTKSADVGWLWGFTEDTLDDLVKQLQELNELADRLKRP